MRPLNRQSGVTGIAVLLLFVVCLTAGAETLFASGFESDAGTVYGTWVSLLPPLIAIGFALWTREVIVSLFAGIWIGTLFLAQMNPISGTALSIDLMIESLVNRDHMAIVVFSLMLGGMVGVMARGGGTHGVVDVLGRFAHTRLRGQLFIWFSALCIFFDDYANTLIRGHALRPMSDRLRISREKLAYIIDSTAAPLAVSAIITTWIGFEITQIRSAFVSMAGQESDPALAAEWEMAADQAFSLFLHSVPYLFYPLLALAFVLMVIVMKKDFGPMLQAERRAVSGGGVLRPGSTPPTDTQLDAMKPRQDRPFRWYNAAVPVQVVIVMAVGGVLLTGYETVETGSGSLMDMVGNSDPFAALLWASFAGSFTAIGMVVWQRILTMKEALEALVAGIQSMLMAIIILVLAWALGLVTQQVGTGPFLASVLQENLPLVLLPALVFIIASATAFSTGTSWGTMAILFPIVIPLAVAMGAFPGTGGEAHSAILLGAISSVMGGAVFGDHCSPISDTTVLSSMSTACDLIDHVRTQLPYALVVAAVALVVGELPAAFEWVHPVMALLAGLVILYLILHLAGGSPEKQIPQSSTAGSTEPAQEETGQSKRKEE